MTTKEYKDSDILRCGTCKRKTTRREADLRMFHRGKCGVCGGTLDPVQEDKSE